jgi:hypothetical protein
MNRYYGPVHYVQSSRQKLSGNFGMRVLMITLAGLLTPVTAVAAEHGDKLSYTERMALYADWSTFIILVIAVIALIRFWYR